MKIIRAILTNIALILTSYLPNILQLYWVCVLSLCKIGKQITLPISRTSGYYDSNIIDIKLSFLIVGNWILLSVIFSSSNLSSTKLLT